MSEAQSHSELRVGSERGFGLVFSALFAVIALWPVLYGSEPRLWSAVLAAAFAVAAFVTPRILRPANLLWARFGILLGKIIAPVVMAIIFFVAVTPTALIMRLLRKDILRLRLEPDAESYWIRRDSSTPPSSMRNQF